MLDRERDALVAAAHRLATEGLVVGTAGNLSARIGNRIAITATGTALEVLTPEQVSVVDPDGNLLTGELQPTSELELHLGVYRRYPAGAIVHTHAPWATALSCVLDELPCIHYQMLPLGGPVRVAPYRLFGSNALAEVTLEALRDRRAALMANHGAIVYGDDITQALESALLLEFACSLYWHAAQLGVPRVLNAEQWQQVGEHVRQLGYGVPRPGRPHGGR